MRNNLPSVTVIIPTRPGDDEVKAVQAARALDYPKEKIEILVARGRQPAVQRNTALRAAQGELIYFLDDDSVPPPDNLQRALPHFADPTVKMVGGPNLCPADAPLLEKVFAVVLSSWLAFGPSRARYARVGKPRPSSEKELILCNLAARRDAVLALGGFDEALYPNEENALMDGLQQRGGVLIYDPQFLVHRRPRPTLKAFIRMLFTYGRGRAEQFRLHPTPGSILNLVPAGLVAYIAMLPVFWIWMSWFALAPLLLYGLAVLLQTVVSAFAHGPILSLLASPLVASNHIFYGAGFWRGLFTSLKRSPDKPVTEVALEKA